jgi:hypothetical protein
MSRLVRRDANIPENRLFVLGAAPVRANLGDVAPAAEAAPAGQVTVDDYATRIVKYVPAEVVAFYLAADKLFAQAPALTGANLAEIFVAKNLYWFSVAVFVLGLIGTPLYLWRQAGPGDPWQVHAGVSTVAFVIWAYAVQGGIFVPIYSAAIAGLLVLVFTFVSGFIKPNK